MLAWALQLTGWASVQLGAEDEGVKQIAEGASEASATGNNSFRSYHLALGAEVHLAAGRVAAGLRAVDDALAVIEETAERFWRAEVHRLRGELLLKADALGAEAEAENEFTTAAGIANEQDASTLAFRAALSLARLWRSKRPEVAQQHLEQACARLNALSAQDQADAAEAGFVLHSQQ